LNVILEFSNLFLKFIKRDEFVLDDDGHLKLLDTVTDRNEFRESPNESGFLDGSNGSFEGGHVGLVIPRLDVEGYERLGNSPMKGGYRD